MSIKLVKPLVFLFSFIICAAIYYPALNGTPIWDDYSFWFNDPVMKPELSYWKIIKDFGWPFSVSLQKFLLQIWGKNYTYYHWFNLILHFINALLVFRLGRVLRLRFNYSYFVLFLFHPAAVISTAWMIQIKTLLSFFFGITGLLAFIKGEKKLPWLALSVLLFALSVTSKSSSLTLPLIFLIIHFHIHKFKRIYFLIPFFLLSFWGTKRVLTSAVTYEGTVKASIASKSKITSPPLITAAETKEVVIKKPDRKEVSVAEKIPPKKVSPKIEAPPVSPEEKIALPKVLRFAELNFGLMIQTSYYYFWQSLIPLGNIPVKGLNYEEPGVTEFIHLFFLFTMVFIFWKDKGLLYLVSAHILLLPFLGIIPAPFMNITWVSDQHLYLVLPALLAFWLRTVSSIKWQYTWIIPGAFTVFFAYEAYKAVPIYKDQITFYEKSFEYNPYNIPIAFNLAHAHLAKGNIERMYDVSQITYELAEETPILKKNIYYPYFAQFYLKTRTELKK